MRFKRYRDDGTLLAHLPIGPTRSVTLADDQTRIGEVEGYEELGKRVAKDRHVHATAHTIESVSVFILCFRLDIRTAHSQIQMTAEI